MLDRYTAELRAPVLPLVYGAKNKDVKRAQEWLTLQGFSTGIDGDFGPATRAAVIAFQTARGCLRDHNEGVVDAETWGALVAPLVGAEILQPGASSFGDAVCRIARAHLAAKAREVGGDNRGAWVRHYGRGLDQSVVDFFPWCQAFANHPWFRAAREVNVPLPFPLTDAGGSPSYYVPWVADSARRAGKFRNGATTKEIIPPGSMFFVPGARGGEHSHIHVGIVLADDGTTIRCVEGNTNEAGGSNGYCVAERFRKKAANDYGLI